MHASLPLSVEVVRSTWAWNYRRPEQSEVYERSAYVPRVSFLRVDGRLGRAAIWAHANPVILPKVDTVLLGRIVGEERRYGAVSWSEVLDVVQRAGFDVTQDPLDIRFLVRPPSIAEWALKLPLVTEEALEKVFLHRVLEDDLVAAAQESGAGELELMDPA